MSDRWDEDARLLELWRAGDARAGEALFSRHADAVARFFENKVRLNADDLTQATFLRMVEGKQRVREGRKFRAWVLGIARNVLHKHLKQLARERELDPSVDSMAKLQPGPVTVIGGRQEHRVLLEGLRALSIDDQMLLELVYWERLSSAELAELLGISASAVRTRTQLARERLDGAMAEAARSSRLLNSTLEGLQGWVDEVRGKLGRERN